MAGIVCGSVGGACINNSSFFFKNYRFEKCVCVCVFDKLIGVILAQNMTPICVCAHYFHMFTQ